MRSLLKLLAKQAPTDRQFTLEVIQRLLLPVTHIIGEDPDGRKTDLNLIRVLVARWTGAAILAFARMGRGRCCEPETVTQPLPGTCWQRRFRSGRSSGIAYQKALVRIAGRHTRMAAGSNAPGCSTWNQTIPMMPTPSGVEIAAGRLGISAR